MTLSIADQVELIVKTLGAMLLGGIIGFEREWVNRPAGFRTHMIVSGASALLVLLGEPLLRFLEDEGLSGLVEADPFRALGAVVTAIAFLGAGTIIQRQGTLSVHGLTTASTLLFAGTIGIAAALDLWVLASSLAGAAVLLLQTLNRFEDWLEKRYGKRGDDSR